MAKIENTTVYPLVTPNASDFVIGTDTSDDNRTVSFKISDITASGGLQDLQSVLDTPTTNTGGTAAGDISLTGNITVNGYIYPTQILAGGAPGSAGQILSSTGTGIQWIAAAGAQGLQDVITVDSNTTLGFVMDNCDIDTTGSINMSGAAQVLALSTNTDMTLAAGCDITTSGNINLSGGSSVLNFGTTAEINDSTGSTGAIGSILTVDAAGTGVEWSTGIPTASMPTLQEVLTAGNTATAIGIQFIGSSLTTFSASSTIQSLANNVWSGTNEFSGNGGTPATSGINLPGSLSDGSGTGTSGQVLTSTATGVSWADLSTIGVSSVSTTPPIVAAFPADPITIAPGVGGVIVRQNIYNGTSLIGCVPAGGTASTFLRGDGTWVTPTGAVSSVSVLASGTSAGLTDAIKISPTTGAVQVQSNAFGGGPAVGHVPDATGNTANFLKGDGTWAAAGGAPEWVQTIGVGSTKIVMTAGNYYMSSAAGSAGVEPNTSNWGYNFGATAPSSTGPSDDQHAMSMVYANSSLSGCATSYPNHTLCDAAIMFSSGYSDTFFVTLWKSPLSGHSIYEAVPAATWTEVITAGTLNSTQNMTISTTGTEILEPGYGFFATVRATTGGVNGSFVARIVLKFSGSV